MKTIGIVMGSKSDLPVAQKAIDTLKELGYEGNFVIEREGGDARVKDINLAKERLEK